MDSINQTNGGEVNSQNPMGVASGMESKEGGKGAMIGTIIIIVLLVVAGAYVYMTRSAVTTGPDETILNLPDTSTDALNQQGTSDEIDAIQQDVNATNLNGLDSDVGNIQNELNAVQ